MGKIIQQCGIQRGRIFRGVRYNKEDYSAVWDKPWKILPRCEIQWGRLFSSVGYKVEESFAVRDTMGKIIPVCDKTRRIITTT